MNPSISICDDHESLSRQAAERILKALTSKPNLIKPLGLSDDRYFGFKSNPGDREAECERIRKRLVAEVPIDLCVLGLGMNGHIAMNEPAPVLQPFAHVAG